MCVCGGGAEVVCLCAVCGTPSDIALCSWLANNDVNTTNDIHTRTHTHTHTAAREATTHHDEPAAVWLPREGGCGVEILNRLWRRCVPLLPADVEVVHAQPVARPEHHGLPTRADSGNGGFGLALLRAVVKVLHHAACTGGGGEDRDIQRKKKKDICMHAAVRGMSKGRAGVN